VPEGTIFITVAEDVDKPRVMISAGKTGTALSALGNANVALAGLALEHGAPYDEVVEACRVSHDKSNGSGYDAKCLADAIADSLEAYRQAH